MGRIGKSFLMNELLRDNGREADSEVFKTSAKGSTAQTKGSWISLYKFDDETKDDAKAETEGQIEGTDAFALRDTFPGDDIEMWSTNDVLTWLKSLNPRFEETHRDVLDF